MILAFTINILNIKYDLLRLSCPYQYFSGGTMDTIKSILLVICLLNLPLINLTAQELMPLYPVGYQESDHNHHAYPDTSIDYWLTHVDDNAEYYLGSGAAGDTFFVTFQPEWSCSVIYAEVQWYDTGIVDAFAAWYSDEALELYPTGQAPDRGTSPVSPIGEWITGPVQSEANGTGWELLDLGGYEFWVGNPFTGETEIFGIGFVKVSPDTTPHILADKMDSKGIRYTYTWFGGPWMSSYPCDWGAYSSNLQSGTVIDAMVRLWVSYTCWPGIYIDNISSLSSTYNQTGPFTVSCQLWDLNGYINEDDIIELRYTVNDGDTVYVPLTEITPGSATFSAQIEGLFNPDDIVSYWIYAVNELGYENTSPSSEFQILEPQNPEAELLLAFDQIFSGRELTYYEALDYLGVEYESWDLNENNGIDESAICYGWDHILLAGWGIDVLSPGDDPNPFIDFLDEGGNLCLIDQEWFSANGFPPAWPLVPGDFAYDYFGLCQYYSDYGDPEAVYSGVYGDPISGSFLDNLYETYWDGGIHADSIEFRPDYIVPGDGEGIFHGIENNDCYGVRNTIGYAKTVYLSFMAEASCEFYVDSVAVSDDFRTLLTNICDWFEIPYTGVESKPSQSVAEFTLHQNYPNPFNAETTISFNLAANSEVKITVYNIYGQLVETLFDGYENADYHQVKWEAGDLASGIYICRVETSMRSVSQKILLLK